MKTRVNYTYLERRQIIDLRRNSFCGRFDIEAGIRKFLHQYIIEVITVDIVPNRRNFSETVIRTAVAPRIRRRLSIFEAIYVRMSKTSSLSFMIVYRNEFLTILSRSTVMTALFFFARQRLSEKH